MNNVFGEHASSAHPATTQDEYTISALITPATTRIAMMILANIVLLCSADDTDTPHAVIAVFYLVDVVYFRPILNSDPIKNFFPKKHHLHILGFQNYPLP